MLELLKKKINCIKINDIYLIKNILGLIILFVPPMGPFIPYPSNRSRKLLKYKYPGIGKGKASIRKKKKQFIRTSMFNKENENFSQYSGVDVIIF